MMRQIFFLIFLSSVVEARPLNQLELYKRCYAQLTGLRPSISDAVTVQIANGQLTALAACNLLLDSAALTGENGTTVANISDPKALAVLRQMHSLHSSWFTF